MYWFIHQRFVSEHTRTNERYGFRPRLRLRLGIRGYYSVRTPLALYLQLFYTPLFIENPERLALLRRCIVLLPKELQESQHSLATCGFPQSCGESLATVLQALNGNESKHESFLTEPVKRFQYLLLLGDQTLMITSILVLFLHTPSKRKMMPVIANMYDDTTPLLLQLNVMGHPLPHWKNHS